MLEYLEKHRKKFLYIPLSLYWLILLIATSLPGKEVPDLGISDKYEHFAAYFILSLLLNLVLILQKKIQFLKNRAFIATVFIVGTYAAFDELHQLLIPGRSCDIADWSADFISACAAVFCLYLILKRKALEKTS